MNALRRVGLAAALVLAVGATANAGGVLVADGGFGGLLEVKEQQVRVSIVGGVAVTWVQQVFRNTEDREVEALYIFPVPNGASVASFSMIINGKEMVGEVVESKRARQIYESYKRRGIDPGLLEQKDHKTFEMRVYPIAARAEQTVRIVYYQELDFDHDLATYVYPLATRPREGLVEKTTGKFSLTLEVLSETPIKQMASPSHGKDFVTVSHAANCWQASLETTEGDLSRDVVIAYQLARPRTGIDLIASRPDGEDGYFALTVTAGPELATPDKGSDYVFILDVSGSMRHDGKLRLSRRSIDAFIRMLDPKDRFEVVTFNVQPAALFDRLEPAGDEARKRAETFLASTDARGGTRLRPAVAVAYKYRDPDRTLNVVILSDGMTEQGERRELMDLIRNRPSGARVFCIGVGNEVERPLLRRVAADAGGFAHFISHGDDFDRQAAAFRRKTARPAATELRLKVEGVEVYDLEPAKLPNLYHGMPVRVYGRYRGGGVAKLVLDASVAGKDVQFASRFELPAKTGGNPQIERMWAWRRIQRLRGPAKSSTRPDAVAEIVRLGEAYSIATEWTSFIVLESDQEYKRWQIERRNTLRMARDGKVDQAARKRFAAIRDKADAGLGPAAARKVRTVQATPPAAIPAIRQPVTQEQRNRRSSGIDLPSFGGGAIDPVSGGVIAAAGAAFWLARRRKRRNHERD